jgi:hypothetical protein
VLRFDPKHRGNAPVKGVETSECFYKIQQILSMRIVNVFYILRCETVSYLCRPGDTGAALKRFIQLEEFGQSRQLDSKDQLIIVTDTFKVLADDLTLESQCPNSVQTVYLFNRNPNAEYVISTVMGDKARELVGDPEIKRRCSELRSYWAQALHHCQQKATDYTQLQNGQRMLLKIIRARWDLLLRQKEVLQRTVIQLESTIDMFMISYHCDLQQRLDEFGQTGMECTQEWKTLGRSVESIKSHKKLGGLYERMAKQKERLDSLSGAKQSYVQRIELEDM